MAGKFVISLDFELIWGIIDKSFKSSYENNIMGVESVIPRLLELANKYDVKLTFGIVGFLYYNSREDIIGAIPKETPSYENKSLSPYSYAEDNTLEYSLHFAPHLISLIKSHKQHEIGSHTYCHYYCQEIGQNVNQFAEDVMMSKEVASLNGVEIKTLIFPRNQCNDSYLDVCKENGIICYRGNESNRLHNAKPGNPFVDLLIRGCRLIDTYVNITGHNSYKLESLKRTPIVNIPASRFFRPYSEKLRFLETLKIRRIRRDMKYAASNNLIYHLWFHPHNIGINQDDNLKELEEIFKYYSFLNKKYGFKSSTMKDIAGSVTNNVKAE